MAPGRASAWAGAIATRSVDLPASEPPHATHHDQHGAQGGDQGQSHLGVVEDRTDGHALRAYDDSGDRTGVGPAPPPPPPPLPLASEVAPGPYPEPDPKPPATATSAAVMTVYAPS